MMILMLSLIFIFIFILYKYIKLEELGYINNNIDTQKEICQATMKRKVIGDIPPILPNGWYSLFYSFEIKIGEVKESNILDNHLAIFRDENGKINIIDAYCSHLGANLAIGGIVKDCTLECPFHGWKFDGNGKCVDIPYSDQKIPEATKIKSWHCLEINSQILVWYDAENREPYWFPDKYEQLNNNNYYCAGTTDNYINCHIQELEENGADIHHLGFLHSPFVLP